MDSIHLPNANELIDASRLPGFEPGKVAIYFAALLLKQMDLPEGLSLGEILSQPGDHDLDRLESWVTEQLALGPTTYRALRDRLNDEIHSAQVDLLSHPGEWGFEPDLAVRGH